MVLRSLFITLSLLFCLSVNSHADGAHKNWLKAKDGDFTMGAPSAKVTIVEYSSLSCVHCASFHQKVFPLLKQNYIDTGKVFYIFRSFPLNAPSLKAELLARCVDKHAYINFINSLFGSQTMWAFTPDYEKILTSIGKLAGIDEGKIKNCLTDQEKIDDILKNTYDSAKVLQITGTPTLFINGNKFEGELSYEKIVNHYNNILP